QVDASPADGEKNTNPATKDAKTTNLNNELVDLMGIDVTFNVVEGDDFQENQDAKNVKEDDEADDGDTGDVAPDDEEVFEVEKIIDQVEFTFDQITFSTNNEVALLYPLHPNSKYFKIVSDFILKCCLKEAFTRAPTQYVEYLAEFWYTTKTLKDSKIWVSTPTREIKGEIDINTFRNALRAHYLPHSGTHPSVLVDKTKFPRDGLKTAHTDLGTNKDSIFEEKLKKINIEDLLNLMQDTRYAFFSTNSLVDEPIIVSDSKEEENESHEDTYATSHNEPEVTSKDTLEQQKGDAEAEVAFLKARTLYPDINQLTELLVTSLKPELTKLLASYDFANCLPTELKELPSSFIELSGDVKELLKHVRYMEIELHGDLKEIPKKLDTFTSTISIQEKLKTLDALPSLLHKVTNTLNMFATVVENVLAKATDKSVPSACQVDASPAEGEKNTNPATKDVETTNLNNELVYLMGIDVVEKYHNKKLLYDKYYDKMLKRRKSSKIINCDVLTQKGPITLKVYRKDGTIEVISNFKVSDLHLAEWREVVQACPDRKEKG
ncbi:hypothetical protein Tco_0355438, partial [Tanacetum coccineum]